MNDVKRPLSSKVLTILEGRLGSGILIAFITIFITRDKLDTWVSALWNFSVSAFDVLRTPIVVAFVVMLGIQLTSIWKSWKLVSLPGMNRILEIDPILGLVNRIRRRHFTVSCVESALAKFRQPNGESYYSFVEKLDAVHFDRLCEGERPALALKLPARKHLALSDFQDLIFLRKTIACGGRVYVLILDIPRSESMGDMTISVSRTIHFVHVVLGSSAKVVRLSSVLASNVETSIRFLLNGYLQYYARDNIFLNEGSDDDRVSHFAFALVLRALAYSTKQLEPILIIQWRKRLDKWKGFDVLKDRWIDGLRVCGLIVGEDFLSHNGMRMSTSGESTITLTERHEVVCERLKALPDSYVNHLCENVFGIAAEAEQRSRLAFAFRRIQKGLLRGIDHG